MRQCIRILFSLIVLACLAAAAAVVCLMVFVDPNKMKPVLIEETLKKTGYYLTIEGNMSWSFYPQWALHINKMSLQAPREPAAFLHLQDVSIAPSLLSLSHHLNQFDAKVTAAEASSGKLSLQHVQAILHWRDQAISVQPMAAVISGVHVDAAALNMAITQAQLEQIRAKLQQAMQVLPEKADQLIHRLLGQ